MTALFNAAPSFCARFGVAALLVILADFLFYGQPIGITVLLFAILVAAAAVAVHPLALGTGRFWLGPAALLVALLPLAENVSLLSASVALAALIVFVLSVSGRLQDGIARMARQIGLFVLAAPVRLLSDFLRWRKAKRRFRRSQVRLAGIAVWLMPLALGAIFLALFGAANPVIGYWLSLIDLLRLLDRIEIARIAFWLIVVAAVWAFLRPRLPRFRRPAARNVRDADDKKAVVTQRHTLEDIVFGRAAILRALIVFNILFSLQTGLDAAYLWGGMALPDGLSYAAYAHRGAYPLIVTALLAAGFMLAALRPGSATSGDAVIRWLVYAWVGQNIMLVISSILRLDLYVGIYALTYLRIAAFIWMGLVAAGLALIIARIALGKSNEWLLSANLLTLSLTLYACCFINFAALIANYNVDHSLEMTGQGIRLDAWYLHRLGPGAFPALDRFLHRQDRTADAGAVREVAGRREFDESRYRAAQERWRAWSFRAWRLLRYLDNRGPFVIPSTVSPVPGR
jgi:hypothetical protein